MKLLCPRSLCGRESGAAGLHCQWHWLELCRLGEWKGPWGTEQMVLGAAQAWVRQWFFLQRAGLWMVSASELFSLKWVLKTFAIIFILPVFMADCSFVK